MTSDLVALIVEHVLKKGYEPRKPRALFHRMGLEAERYDEFRQTLRELVRMGRLKQGKDRTIRAVEPAVPGVVVGTFRRTARGHGYVRPKKATGRESDIYVPVEAALDASTGDEVSLKITGRSHRGGAAKEGRIIRVVSRASGQFVGTYSEEDGEGIVRVDGTTFQQPISVGDPGAKGARAGDKVAIEMVRYPAPGRVGEGVIIEVLGPRGTPGVDTLTVIRAFNIPDEFDDETLENAREKAAKFNEEDVAARLDLREVLTVTIDPVNARDFDDAISLSRDERGFWTLWVHVADVSHFVRNNEPLDKTARRRGTSVYLPDRVIPMLPEVLSNSLASLQEGRTRYTLSARMEFDPEGRRTDREFARTAIRVDKRLTYEQAYAVMKDQGEPGTEVSDEVRVLLKQMLELAMILRKRRFQRGALELVMPDVEVDLDAEGVVVGAHLASDDESHQVIEEFMLAANEAVAEYLAARGVTTLRRGHAEPDLAKLRQFAGFVQSLGFVLDPPTSRFELQKVLAWSDNRPERYAVHFGLLRSLKQATYTIEPEGHFALASDDYCHFTSPIRRYPDLIVHRQLAALIAGKTPKGDPDELAVLAEHCSRTERRAEAAERELIKIKLLTHLEGRVGEEFHAVIIGVEDFGLFCQLVELPVEGLLHVTSLGDDFYYLEAETHTLVGRRSGRRFRLGDRIEVRVARVDVDRRELDLVAADRPWEPHERDDGPVRRPRAGRPKRPSETRAAPTNGKTRPKPPPKKGKKRRGK